MSTSKHDVEEVDTAPSPHAEGGVGDGRQVEPLALLLVGVYLSIYLSPSRWPCGCVRYASILELVGLDCGSSAHQLKEKLAVPSTVGLTRGRLHYCACQQ